MILLADESLLPIDEYKEQSLPFKDKIDKIYNFIKEPLELIYGNKIGISIYNHVKKADELKDLDKLKYALRMIQFYFIAIRAEIKEYENMYTRADQFEDYLISQYPDFDIYGSNIDILPETTGRGHRKKKRKDNNPIASKKRKTYTKIERDKKKRDKKKKKKTQRR